MPKESETIFDEPEDNPKEEPEGEQGEQEQPEEQEPSEEDGKGEEEKKEEQFIEGTPYKTQEDLVKGYKEIQSRATKAEQELSDAKKRIDQLIPMMTQGQKQEVKQEMQVDPDAFLKKFVSDPRGTLLNIVKEAQKESSEPVEAKLHRLESMLEINDFKSKHPELTDNDFDEITKLVNLIPEIRTRSDRLEIYLKLLQQNNPEVAQRISQQKADLEKGASSAKAAAGLGGKKSRIPTKPAGDEFDEILAEDREHRKKFDW